MGKFLKYFTYVTLGFLVLWAFLNPEGLKDLTAFNILTPLLIVVALYVVAIILAPIIVVAIAKSYIKKLTKKEDTPA